MSTTLQELSTFLFSPLRCFQTDEEEWIEGGVGEFLEVIRPFLEARGIVLTISDEQIGKGAGYSLAINGEVVCLYTEAELAATRGQETLARTTALVNRLLREAGAVEQMYCYSGWNELAVIFLTREEHARVCATLEAAGDDQVPYDPSREATTVRSGGL
jgi:hypothetical protein